MKTVKRTPTTLRLHYSKEILLNFNLMSSRFHFYHKDEFHGSYFKIHFFLEMFYHIYYYIKGKYEL